VIAKIVIPVFFLVKFNQFNFLSMIIISVFYLYMTCILYSTLNNRDLKKRIYFIKQVIELITFSHGKENNSLNKTDFN